MPAPYSLSRMKALALGLLVLAALVYVAATLLEPRHAAWGYVAAAAEAAMIGALADWFAVVALFRHPLGLPFPHTAIIPNKKNSLGESLGVFVRDHFLDSAMLLEKLRSLDPAARLGQWLSQPEQSERVSRALQTAMGEALLRPAEELP